MNNKEAVEAIIKNWPPENYTLLREALNMAIGLLEKEITLEDKINFIKECKQKTDSKDNYSVGLHNGLELALSIIDGREAVFKACEEEEPIEDKYGLINSILSCFSNKDLQHHLHLRFDKQNVVDDTIKSNGKEVYLKQNNGPQQENKSIYFGE